MPLYFHGIDKHKHYSTVSKFNIEGKEIQYTPRCDLLDYIQQLSKSGCLLSPKKAADMSLVRRDRLTI